MIYRETAFLANLQQCYCYVVFSNSEFTRNSDNIAVGIQRKGTRVYKLIIIYRNNINRFQIKFISRKYIFILSKIKAL